MKKIITLIKREYKEAVFKKSFLIITLLTPLLLIALGVLPSFLLMLETEKSYTIHVIDESGLIADQLSASLQETLKDGKPKYIFHEVSVTKTALPDSMNIQKGLISEDKIDGLLYIPASIADTGNVEFYSQNVANLGLNRELQETVNKIVSTYRIHQSGLNPLLVEKLTKHINMKTIKITKEGEESESGFVKEYFSTFIFVLILYMSLILYGTSIMRGIIQEKTTRIIEILLSTASAFQLMAGKILGLGAVGLTQYLIWATVGMLVVIFGSSILPQTGQFLSLNPIIFVYFVVFYILGYFLFSALYASIGAMTNSDQEAQNLSTPVVMILVVPIVMLGFIIKNPDSALSIFLSQFPLFSPIIMFTRINITQPSTLEILSSIIILMVTNILLIWLTSKIYRVGILMYGKRPSLAQVLKWIKYK
ncbi:MAG TPA: ABC transporter permease [Calditrichaeota bacterium]|nr:ABC transporter permease [Calditrichota bacterium]